MSSIYELYTSGGSGIRAKSDPSKYQYYIFHIGFTNEVAIGDRGRNEICKSLGVRQSYRFGLGVRGRENFEKSYGIGGQVR